GKVGNPDKCVIHITGDGSFRMNCNELATEEYYKLPIITFIFDNGCLGMVRQWQELMYEGRYSATILDRGPDFVKLAEAYGLKGRRVTNVDELKAAIEEALEEGKEGRGYVVDCAVAQSELVRPMVNGGTHITEFLLN
ncbi:MAG: acetolactate synthase large subunit, partial [Firmicutes bacterium]|nr:acetolactate synthase large subunit [Bacillota bacterium]